MEVSRNQASCVDAAVLARVAKGDIRAFDQLYEQTSPILYALAVRVLNNRDDAAELLQEVYVEAWRKVDRYEGQRGSPMAWLVTLTRSRAIDRLRAGASRARDVSRGTDEQTVQRVRSGAPDPFDDYADRELRVLVESALSELPAAQQQAVELAFYEGLTHTEIAARLKEPIGTIKTRIKLGMNKLRTALRPVRS